jgi:hypothetical protein
METKGVKYIIPIKKILSGARDAAAAWYCAHEKQIERWIAIILLVSVLLFGIADWLGVFGAACTCK